MSRRVAIVKTDISEERIASIIRKEDEILCHIVFLDSVFRLIVTGNVASSSSILFTLMMEAIRSSEMWVLTRTTQRIIPENVILHIHRGENLNISLFIIRCRNDVLAIVME
jgi:hypothetical protein